MQTTALEWKTISPPAPLTDFVESFWTITNHTGHDHHVVIIPDGRFDIIFSLQNNGEPEIILRGLDTQPEQAIIPADTIFCAVSFKLLAIEYLLDQKVDSLLNAGLVLPPGFWNVTKDDLKNMEAFCEKVSAKMSALIKPGIDDRKRQLFNLIYSSNGTLAVKELSEKVFWSSRQINRYFNDQFGISLKAYCSIIRFRASLHHIKAGKLYPELNYTDQTHFIKEVKKMTGVTPKELSKNENDRFILLSALPKK
jgi:AraC-like DNA-binding protein